VGQLYDFLLQLTQDLQVCDLFYELQDQHSVVVHGAVCLFKPLSIALCWGSFGFLSCFKSHDVASFSVRISDIAVNR
jgi:hypothetical protein